jgi:hypothetical protein
VKPIEANKRGPNMHPVMSALLPKADMCSANTHVREGPKADTAARYEFLAVATQPPLSTSHFETRVYFVNHYIGMIFEGLSKAFVNVRAALRPSDFLVLHFRFARDRRLFKGNLVGLGQFCCVGRHRHK